MLHYILCTGLVTMYGALIFFDGLCSKTELYTILLLICYIKTLTKNIDKTLMKTFIKHVPLEKYVPFYGLHSSVYLYSKAKLYALLFMILTMGLYYIFMMKFIFLLLKIHTLKYYLINMYIFKNYHVNVYFLKNYNSKIYLLKT